MIHMKEYRAKGFSHYSIRQYQPVEFRLTLPSCAGAQPELKHAEGTEGPEQRLRGRVCLATCARAPPAEGTAGALLRMASAVPHCVNRNPTILLNRPSNVSIPQGICEVRLFVGMCEEIVSQLES